MIILSYLEYTIRVSSENSGFILEELELSEGVWISLTYDWVSTFWPDLCQTKIDINNKKIMLKSEASELTLLTSTLLTKSN